MKLQTGNILHSISCFLFLAKKGQSKPVVLIRSTLHRDLHLPLGPFAWTLIWADFQEAKTFCQSTTVVLKSQRASCFFSSSFLEVSRCERATLIHSFIHLQYPFYPGQGRGGSAWLSREHWEQELGIHPWMGRRSIAGDQAHTFTRKDVKIIVIWHLWAKKKQLLSVCFQSWTQCILSVSGAAERSRAEPLWERRVGEWGRLSHGHCRNFPTIKQINRVLCGAVSGPQYTGGGLLWS